MSVVAEEAASLHPEAVLARCDGSGGVLPGEFVEPFTVLARSLDEEGGLTRVGRRLVQHQLLRIVRQRMLLESQPPVEWAREPKVVVVVGLPRTGTTLLHHLLAACFEVDAIPFHEALEPFDGAPDLPGDRRGRAAGYLAFVDRLSPGLRARHPITVDGPEECDVALQLTAMSEWFTIAHRVPTYASWCSSASWRDAYATYRRLLTVLRPAAEVLVLKSPSHLGHLGELFATFADVRVVWLHRPVAQVVPSFLGLVAAARTVTALDPGVADDLRAEWVPRLARRVHEAGPWRRDPRVLHLRYDDLVRRRELTLARVAAHAGLRLRPEALNR